MGWVLREYDGERLIREEDLAKSDAHFLFMMFGSDDKLSPYASNHLDRYSQFIDFDADPDERTR